MNQTFELYGTPHSWICVKSFLTKPKVKLVETYELEGKIRKGLLEQFGRMGIPSEYKYMMMKDSIEQVIFKILRKNKKFIKGFDYVVPSHISVYNGTISITLDCFKKVKK